MPEPIRLDDGSAEFLRPRLKLEKFFPERLTPEEVRKVFPNSGLYSYPKDDYILYQGEESKDVYIILWGSVSITQTAGTAGVQLAVLGPGSIFGEMALLRDGVRVASAIAAEDSGVFKLAYADVQALLAANRALGAHLKNLALERSAGKQA
ncbi:MAG: cyclic nucleotide-binding domain-containing protein [Elusimicrobiota bacterium]